MSAVKAMLLHRDLPFHGGVAQSFLTFARYRDRRRLNLVVGALQRPSCEMRDMLLREGVMVIELGDRYPTAIQYLRSMVVKEQIRVVVCTSFKSYLVAKAATIRRRCSVVFWVPSIPLIIEGRFRRLLFRVLARGDHLVFISEAVSDAHLYRYHRGRRSIIYYGLEDPLDAHSSVSAMDTVSRDEIAIPKDAIVLGFVAEFVEWKDHRTLLRAFGEISKVLTNVHLLLLGTGSLLSELQAYAKTMPGGDRIHFLGAKENSRQFLRVMDVYVHPALGEGFGLAVAEAMLEELPVIAARAGALPEFVVDGQTGLLFSPGNSEDLYAKIEMLTGDPQLRKRLGSAARDYCLRNFSPNRFAHELTTVIEMEDPA